MRSTTRSTAPKLSVKLAGVTALVAGATALMGLAPAVAATPTVTYAGGAYGSVVRLGTLVQSGRTSSVAMCTPTGQTVNKNNTAAIDLGAVGHIGAVTTRVASIDSPAPQSTASAKTAATNLLRSAVTAQAITATATVTQTASGYTTTGQSTIVGLSVDGHAVDGNPAPNTTIPLPGIGRVVLNRQTTSTQYGIVSITVAAITVLVDPDNNRGVPAGTIVVSSATGALHRPTYSRATGFAFGTSAQVGSVIKSGQTALVTMPCGGSNGEVVKNTIETTTIPDLLHTGTVVSTAVSTDSATSTTAKTSAQVEDLNFLNGQVQASAISTRANATRSGTDTTFTGSGTTFTRLVIGGHVIKGNPPRNTTFTIAGIATIYANVVTINGSVVSCEGLKIVLGSAQGNLPAGAVINVAVARAGVVK